MKIYYLLLAPLFASCSVVIASSKCGVNLEMIQRVSAKQEILDLGGELIATQENVDGGRIETYQVLKEKGSTARALLHGVLDAATFFMWELAATPIETSLCQDKYFMMKVAYNENEEISKIELY